MVRTMYLRRCFYKASLEAETLTFLSRCVRVSFCALIKEKTGSPFYYIYLETAKLEARKEIRKNLIRYLVRCSIEHLKRKTLAMCIHIW